MSSVRLPHDTYAALAKEAERRGVALDELASELLRARLAAGGRGEIEAALDVLADMREGLPIADAVALVREGRA
jgi:hypothetical protein